MHRSGVSSSTRGQSSGVSRNTYNDVEDRLQRALQENAQIKQERRELQDKLRRVQTQFRRLVADWRRAQGGGRTATDYANGTEDDIHSTTGHSLRARTELARPATAQPHRTTSIATSPVVGLSLPSLHPNITGKQTAPAASTTVPGHAPQLQPSAGAAAATSSFMTLTRHDTAAAGAAAASSFMQPPSLNAPPPSLAASLPTAGATAQELAQCQAALRVAERELAELRQKVAAAATTTTTTTTRTPAAPLTASVAAPAAASDVAARHALEQELMQARMAQEQMERQYRQTIEQLAQQRQALETKVRLLEQSAALEAQTKPVVDPMRVVELESELRTRAQQATLTQGQLQQSAKQAETLKAECARLVEELQRSQAAQAELRRQLFALEQEKSALQARSTAAADLEQALQSKSAELRSTEQELLKTVNSLRTCSRETEAAVRQEMQGRVIELQAMRDDAEGERRRTERVLADCRHDLAEAQRLVSSLREDVRLHQAQVARVEREKDELTRRLDLAHHMASELTDEDIDRAIAIAALRRRSERDRRLGLVQDAEERPPKAHAATARDAAAAKPSDAQDKPAAAAAGDGGGGDAHEEADAAKKALDLFRDLTWDETWEQGEVREAYSRVVLDLQLTEARSSELAQQAEQQRTALQKLSAERDELLEENLEMRQRLTRVQTVFAKQQLQAYRAAMNASRHNNNGSSISEPASARDGHLGSLSAQGGQIDFCIRAVQSEAAALLRALGIASMDAPTAIFFTLDGLRAYDTMLSPTLYTLGECVDTHFQYVDLDPNEITLAEVQRTTFVLQLHRVQGGSGSQLVAAAELPGMALLAAREVSIEEPLALVDGEGHVLGRVVLEMCCSRLLLPILLQSPLGQIAAANSTNGNTKEGAAGAPQPLLMSAADVKAALVAMRAVRYLRVQVFRAQGLASSGSSTNSSSLPQPYVFYTAHSPVGALSCIRDTAVYPANQAFTTDPVFDAAPTDHRVVVDRELLHFIAHGTIVFVVFDARAKEVESNLGMLELPLRPLLASPQAIIRETAKLHPQGTLTVGLSWITVGP